MSALPPFHQFRHGRLLQDGAPDASSTIDDTTPWNELVTQDEQETWHYRRRRHTDSSGTELYPHALRIMLIVGLSLVCWAMVLAVWHLVAGALH